MVMLYGKCRTRIWKKMIWSKGELQGLPLRGLHTDKMILFTFLRKKVGKNVAFVLRAEGVAGILGSGENGLPVLP